MTTRQLPNIAMPIEGDGWTIIHEKTVAPFGRYIVQQAGQEFQVDACNIDLNLAEPQKILRAKGYGQAGVQPTSQAEQQAVLSLLKEAGVTEAHNEYMTTWYK